MGTLPLLISTPADAAELVGSFLGSISCFSEDASNISKEGEGGLVLSESSNMVVIRSVNLFKKFPL